MTKHNEKVSRGDYPSLPDIKNVDFSQLQEEVSIVFFKIFYWLLCTFQILQFLYFQKIAKFTSNFNSYIDIFIHLKL